MKKTNLILNMMITNAAMGAAMTVEEAKLISRCFNGTKER